MRSAQKEEKGAREEGGMEGGGGNGWRGAGRLERRPLQLKLGGWAGGVVRDGAVRRQGVRFTRVSLPWARSPQSFT